jgi:hypothetical protein
MPESRLFMSSLSRRQLAKRRPGRSSLRSSWVARLLVLVVVCAAAFVIGHGGL